jgi:hypothetical protein
MKEKLLHELKVMVVVFLYLALFFCAVATYWLLLPQPLASSGLIHGKHAAEAGIHGS